MINEMITYDELLDGTKVRIGTVTLHRGALVSVFLTEEEWFRSVLGDEEFERRAEAQFVSDQTRRAERQQAKMLKTESTFDKVRDYFFGVG